MSTNDKTFAYGTLGENGDTWFLMTPNQMILVDAPFLVDLSLEGKPVSIAGHMGIPAGSPFTKLIADKIASHEAIALRAYEIYQSGHGGTADDNWFRAERELLGL